MKKRQNSRKSEITRFTEYMVGGGLWFWSGYIIIVYLNGRMPLFLVNFIGNAVGISLNFLVERYWAFKTNRPTNLIVASKRYIIYTILNAFILNYLILAVLKTHYRIPPKYGQFIAAGFFTLWNYFWYKYWVFKGQERHKRLRHHA